VTLTHRVGGRDTSGHFERGERMGVGGYSGGWVSGEREEKQLSPKTRYRGSGPLRAFA
jgi:hypothetical protein